MQSDARSPPPLLVLCMSWDLPVLQFPLTCHKAPPRPQTPHIRGWCRLSTARCPPSGTCHTMTSPSRVRPCRTCDGALARSPCIWPLWPFCEMQCSVRLPAAWLLARLSARLPARLPACLPACLPASCVRACVPAHLLVCVFVCARTHGRYPNLLDISHH